MITNIEMVGFVSDVLTCKQTLTTWILVIFLPTLQTVAPSANIILLPDTLSGRSFIISQNGMGLRPIPVEHCIQHG